MDILHKMKVTLVNYTQDAARMLVLATSTRLNMDDDLMLDVASMADDEILKMLDYIAKTIPTAWEFVDYTFLIQGVTRDCFKQMLRTRTYSAAEQTFRLGDHGDFDMMYLSPSFDECGFLSNPKVYDIVSEFHQNSRIAYKKLVESGRSAEEARCVIPGSAKSNMLLKCNLRTLADVASKRLGGRTQGEHRLVVQQMVDEVIRVHPWAEKFLYQKGKDYFKDIEEFAKREFGSDPVKKGELLKIVDKMRAEK